MFVSYRNNKIKQSTGAEGDKITTAKVSQSLFLERQSGVEVEDLLI